MSPRKPRSSSSRMLSIWWTRSTGSAATTDGGKASSRRSTPSRDQPPTHAASGRSRASPGFQLSRSRSRPSRNRHQQIVEVVRHAAGELADGLHLLRLAKLLLKSPPVRLYPPPHRRSALETRLIEGLALDVHPPGCAGFARLMRASRSMAPEILLVKGLDELPGTSSTTNCSTAACRVHAGCSSG